MKTMISDVRDYTFSDEDKLLVDTNVWLSVYGPMPFRRKRAVAYSDALAKIKRAGCLVSIDVVIVSEFINQYARMEFNQRRDPTDNDFKGYRNSEYFKPIANSIAITVMGMLRNCRRCDSEFPELKLSPMFASFAEGGIDFNDQVIAEICKNNGYTLLTDDGDFNDPDIAVLTANGQLLSS